MLRENAQGGVVRLGKSKIKILNYDGKLLATNDDGWKFRALLCGGS